jgi:hypothetical protein
MMFAPPGKRTSALWGTLLAQVIGQLIIVCVVVDVMIVSIESIHLLLLWRQDGHFVRPPPLCILPRSEVVPEQFSLESFDDQVDYMATTT